ncbi:MAG: hypothetical protein Q9M23_02830 [Mariprofundaceae bacterium]|nr:hypothetical protein [Mariprofundaceae bacterium]
MTAQLISLPGTFPLHEDKPFTSESEWVILKLLCRPLDSLADADGADADRADTDEKTGAEELALASGNQFTVERCRELIAIVRISKFQGLGSWMARLLVEAGLSEHDVVHLSAEELCARVNEHMGYTICNTATCRALEGLQDIWRKLSSQEES